MSGFSADWLDLREPFDRAARNLAVSRELRHLRCGEQALQVVDLGTGTGANLRYLAPRLGGEQHWRVIDHDPCLLAALREHLGGWAQAEGYRFTEGGGAGLGVIGSDFDCRVDCVVADMAGCASALPLADAGLITASALLDLVSDAWLDALLAACRAVNAAVLFGLTYDGQIEWRPEDSDDSRVCALVNRHQRRDKGFGPALGPSASDRVEALLRMQGYRLAEGCSDWEVGPDGSALQRALADGWAEAAAEVAPWEAGTIEGWRARRLEWLGRGTSNLRVGHRDVLAWLP